MSACFSVLWLGVCCLHGIFAVSSGPPHIVVILADDLGWATVGWHDSEVQTPFIDKLGIHLGMYILPQILKMSKQATYHCHQFGKWHGGMSNVAYLPANRGFDSSFGYLGGAEDHYTHVQGQGIDFWNTTQPILGYKGVYGDLIYNELAVNTIKQFSNKHGEDDTQRLFAYIALQVVHDPQEVPAEYLDLYPSNMFSRRRSMDAMASLMDNAVMNITNALKSAGLWNNTILLFSADNGGATGVNSKSGNNWPLRGGKHSDFEGGVRAAAFITGGYIPQDRKNQTLDGYIHVCDWYETFARLVGVDTSKLPPLTNETIPGLDSFDVWPLITGENVTSPRVEIPLSSVGALYGSAFISGQYKIVLTSQNGLGFFTGPQSPNETAPYQDAGCPSTCLFDIINDPTEHVDLSEQYPEIKQSLLARHYAISNTSFQTDCYGATVNATQAKQNAIDAQIDGVWAPYNMCLMTN